MCSQPLYATFAFYLTNVYVIRAGHKNQGQHLGLDTVKALVRNLIRLGNQRFPDSSKSSLSHTVTPTATFHATYAAAPPAVLPRARRSPRTKRLRLSLTMTPPMPDR